MTIVKIAEKDLHSGWLDLARIMLQRHGPDTWAALSQGMQSAYYMGAMAAAVSTSTRSKLLKQAASGMADALGVPGLKLTIKETS